MEVAFGQLHRGQGEQGPEKNSQKVLADNMFPDVFRKIVFQGVFFGVIYLRGTLGAGLKVEFPGDAVGQKSENDAEYEEQPMQKQGNEGKFGKHHKRFVTAGSNHGPYDGPKREKSVDVERDVQKGSHTTRGRTEERADQVFAKFVPAKPVFRPAPRAHVDPVHHHHHQKDNEGDFQRMFQNFQIHHRLRLCCLCQWLDDGDCVGIQPASILNLRKIMEL